MNKSQYEKLGIDPMKQCVRDTFYDLIDNNFPGAWVNIVRDPDFPGYVFTQHNDGDGSKIIQRLLIYKEIGDISVIGGAVDDALQMNLGDIAASGFVKGKIVVTDIIDINGFNVPKDIVMSEIKRRFAELKELHSQYGFKIFMTGGETADLPDQVQSMVFNVSTYSRAKEEEIISGMVKPDDVIYGFASDGQATWEKESNSGIQANGLTLARKVLMHKSYNEKYPELSRPGEFYSGKNMVSKDSYRGGVAEALISPTRQWSILIAILIEKLREKNALSKLHGISFNTGGGATKIKHLGQGGILYKKIMPIPPWIFGFIQKESEETWRNMFQTFNCGIGIDIIGEFCDELIDALNATTSETGVAHHRLGYCEETEGENKVELITDFGNFNY